METQIKLDKRSINRTVYLLPIWVCGVLWAGVGNCPCYSSCPKTSPLHSTSTHTHTHTHSRWLHKRPTWREAGWLRVCPRTLVRARAGRDEEETVLECVERERQDSGSHRHYGCVSVCVIVCVWGRERAREREHVTVSEGEL